MLEKFGTLYGSYYRGPDAFWEEEVFVCPFCQYATIIDLAQSGSEDTCNEFYCKYCYKDWVAVDGCLKIKQPVWNDNGKETGHILI